MFIANTFDIMLEFNQRVIKDLQVRTLNMSADTNLWMKGPFSRIIEQQVPPLQVKACWNKPSTEICTDDKNDLIELSAEVNGGARQIMTGRILTIDGEVSMKLPVVLDMDHNGRPYAHLAPPKPLRLHMKKLKVTYEGSKWPEFLAKFDPEKEATSLRPVLTTELMGPLAGIPLTYMPCSLPVTMPLQSGKSNGALPITQAQAQLVKNSNSVVLGLMLDQARSAPSVFSTLLAGKRRVNAALGLSTEGLNSLLSYLCQQGQATGSLVHSLWGPMSWQWESLTATLHRDRIHLTGALQQQGSKIIVDADVRCFLDNNGCLQCGLVSTNIDTATGETILASWPTLLKALFRWRVPGKQDRNQRHRERLYQCFNIPGTSKAVEVAACALVVEDGRLILYYRIPRTFRPIQVAKPPAKPTVVISQVEIPQQIAQGVPVTTQMEAKVTKESSPPYDYVWTIDRSPEPRPEHGPRLAITKIPHQPVRTPGPQKLADVHLKVIDMFGQVSDTHAPAQYIPLADKQKQDTTQPQRSQKQQQSTILTQSPQKQQRSSVKDKKKSGIGCSGLLLVAIAIIRLLAALPHHGTSIPSNSTGTSQTPGLYMTFTGALNGSLSVPHSITCGVSKLDSGNYEIQASGNINGTSYLLLIQVSPYSGPGTYSTSDSSGLVALQGDSDGWGSHGQPGSITITGNGTGSVSATMGNDNSQVQVSGSWTCS